MQILLTSVDMSKCLSKTTPRSHTVDSNLIVLAPIFMEEMGSVLRNFEEKRKTLALAVFQSRKFVRVPTNNVACTQSSILPMDVFLLLSPIVR